MSALKVHPQLRRRAPAREHISPVFQTPARSEHLAIEDLRELMRCVNDTTLRLHATHSALHQQVEQLQRELAEANAALRRSQTLATLGEMAAGIAHEVRNPLGSIQLYVQMLAEDLAARPDQAELCRKIDRAVTGLDAIVRDVLALARKRPVSLSPVSCDELFVRALALCDSLLESGSVNVVQAINVHDSITVDPNMLTQALANLIRNAVESMIESNSVRREIRVEASEQQRRCPTGQSEVRIVLAVRDTGPGVPEHVIGRIFNPFFTTRKSGTGLGLAIVHRIAEAHDGHVSVKNDPGGGACVELCLPLRSNLTTKEPQNVTEDEYGPYPCS